MSIIIADASPLIALATIERLDLLHKLYQEVIIPVAVEQELKLDSGLPGSRLLKQAIDKGWLQVIISTFTAGPSQQLLQLLDPGETEAILLVESHAKTQTYQFLLIDERKGRKVAKRRGIKVAGTGAVLIAAKNNGYIESVQTELLAMQKNGYQLSKSLIFRLLQLADE